MTYRSGRYTATPDLEEKPPEETWIIHDENGAEVGKLFGPLDRFGRPVYASGACTASMSKLVWSGPTPDGCADPRTPHYGMCFDVSPTVGAQATLDRFAKQADRLRAWRDAGAVS